uniref:Putative kunitz-type peptidase inhibitor n=1 Tax=Amblyomma cajennense TaxID=34607 RepID=A0A023FT03_AMBCJ
MQLLTLLALLCLLGSTLSKGALSRRCRKPEENARSTCPNGKENTLRFTYDRNSKKCHQYWQSGCDRRRRNNINSFDDFTECMRECNPTSKCLQTPKKHRWFPLFTTYVFNRTTMKCEEKKSFRKPDIGDEYNRFKKEKDCKSTCEPTLQIIITNSG